jgi:hypothetical protein
MVFASLAFTIFKEAKGSNGTRPGLNEIQIQQAMCRALTKISISSSLSQYTGKLTRSRQDEGHA